MELDSIVKSIPYSSGDQAVYFWPVIHLKKLKKYLFSWAVGIRLNIQSDYN